MKTVWRLTGRVAEDLGSGDRSGGRRVRNDVVDLKAGRIGGVVALVWWLFIIHPLKRCELS